MTQEVTPGAPAAPAITAPAAPVAPAGPAVELQIGDAPAAAPAPVAEPTVQYEPTGDVGLDLALDFVGRMGIADNDPAMKAASAGDFGPLKAKLAALGDKAQGWERHVELGERSFKESSDKHAAKVTKDKELIHNAVGGAEQWDAISKWAGVNAEPAEKEQVNIALKQGGLVGKAMAMWLASQYSKAAGTTFEPQAAVTKPGAAVKAEGSSALDSKTYATEVQKMRQQLGQRFDSSPQYAALQQRRLAGQRAGLK